MRAALLVAALLAGCNSPTTTQTDVFVAETFTLPPRGSHEFNFAMEANQSVHVEFTASANVTWDVHSHPGGKVRTWQEGSGLAAQIDFTAPEPDTYSVWIRSASATDVEVRYEMTGEFELVE